MGTVRIYARTCVYNTRASGAAREAKHSVERSPWHCCKNKRIADRAAYPPRLRGLCFIYDTVRAAPGTTECDVTVRRSLLRSHRATFVLSTPIRCGLSFSVRRDFGIRRRPDDGIQRVTRSDVMTLPRVSFGRRETTRIGRVILSRLRLRGRRAPP